MRTSLEQINVISRNTQGVRIMKIPDGTKVASVALTEKSSADDSNGSDEAE